MPHWKAWLVLKALVHMLSREANSLIVCMTVVSMFEWLKSG